MSSIAVSDLADVVYSAGTVFDGLSTGLSGVGARCSRLSPIGRISPDLPKVGRLPGGLLAVTFHCFVFAPCGGSDRVLRYDAVSGIAPSDDLANPRGQRLSANRFFGRDNM